MTREQMIDEAVLRAKGEEDWSELRTCVFVSIRPAAEQAFLAKVHAQFRSIAERERIDPVLADC